MTIWLVRREDGISYDEMAACVVVAPDEQSARAFAAGKCGDEGPEPWEGASCAPVDTSAAGVVLVDFRAG